MRSRYSRLSLVDQSALSIERSDTPAHLAGLCILRSEPLLDATGILDLEMIKRRLNRRLVRVPALRKVVQATPPLGGAPLWIDDPRFSLDRHIRTAQLAPPGDQATLFRTVELVLRQLLDRSRPLWELWFFTGLDDGHVGLLVKIHHALADGGAAVALVMSLLDLAPDTPDPPASDWVPTPMPSPRALFCDTAGSRLLSLRETLAHPKQIARRVGVALTDSGRFLRRWNAAPRMSLNSIPEENRLICALPLDLEAARTVAHAHHAKINDVVLTVVSGGARELLRTRGEPTAGMELTALVPATLRAEQAAGQLGNAVGMYLIQLPVGEPTALGRLLRIAALTQAARTEQHPRYLSDLLGIGAAIGVARPFLARQRMANIFVTDVPGPPAPCYFLGARIEEAMPLIGPAGNVTLMFAALSYGQRLTILLTASAAAYPDIDVLVTGMRRSWEDLIGRPAMMATPAFSAQEEIELTSP
jgi:diacylglycerol O-acyltransferase / wax synthase